MKLRILALPSLWKHKGKSRQEVGNDFEKAQSPLPTEGRLTGVTLFLSCQQTFLKEPLHYFDLSWVWM